MSFESHLLTTSKSNLLTTPTGAGLLGWRVNNLELLKSVGAANDWTALSSFPCGPLSHGRLRDSNGTSAAMSFEGKLHQLDASQFVNVDQDRDFANPAIHGFWPNQKWIVQYTSSRSVGCYKTGTPESSPFHVIAMVEYKLSESSFICHTSVSYPQRGPYGCCHHPGFSLNPAGTMNEKVMIKIPAARRRWPKDQTHGCLLFNGMPLDDLGGMNVDKGIPVGTEDRWDDAFLLDPCGEHKVELIFEKAGITVEITFSQDCNHVVLCSCGDFIYIEPCTSAGNAVNLAAMGLPDEITGHRVIEAGRGHTWWWGAEVSDL